MKPVAEIIEEFPITLAHIKAMKAGETMKVVVISSYFRDYHGHRYTVREAFTQELLELQKLDDDFDVALMFQSGSMDRPRLVRCAVEHKPGWWYSFRKGEINSLEVYTNVTPKDLEDGWAPPHCGWSVKNFPMSSRIGSGASIFVHPDAIEKYGDLPLFLAFDINPMRGKRLLTDHLLFNDEDYKRDDPYTWRKGELSAAVAEDHPSPPL